MVLKMVRARAPATIGNVACGFDVFGLALNEPFDEVRATRRSESGVRLLNINGNGQSLPLEVDKNTASAAVAFMLRDIAPNAGIELELFKNMPLASGLGSSAASAVAALVATNELLGKPLSRHQMLSYAMKSEKVACGTAHADNVAPSMLGGFTIVRCSNPVDVVKIPCPKDLCCIVVHPQLKLETRTSREVIPENISLGSAVQNWANCSAMIAALFTSDFDLIARSLQDNIFEPKRAKLVKGFESVKTAALEAGALGCSLSGSGPSVFALGRTSEIADKIASQMKAAFDVHGVSSEAYVSFVNTEGASIIERE